MPFEMRFLHAVQLFVICEGAKRRNFDNITVAILFGYNNRTDGGMHEDDSSLLHNKHCSKRGNFRAGQFSLLPSSRKLPPRENKTHMPS